MPPLTAADTVRVLVATDNHVGYAERDAVRGNDSWKSFHEIMCLAKDRDVDMVLLAGDLFHENKPSRKAMYHVMRSIRMNCFGPKPCELELLTDGSEHFDPTFDFANYEDPNLNVSIPIFSIHGNHDDPAGEGHLAALDILGMSGFLNYFGRVPDNSKIRIQPLLFQKGRTKLALYGMSNVRDETLFQTLKAKNGVIFHQPGIQKGDWFNVLCVHQNHAAHTETSYLPEDKLPDFLDLVIWGHEHDCQIDPTYNSVGDFRVIQPGSSIATSLSAGEAIPKQVCILSITGRELKSEPIRLKTVRPFVFKDIVLADSREAMRIAKKDNHRTDLTRFLISIVEELIEQAKAEWQGAQGHYEPPPSSIETANGGNAQPTQNQCPLPLIRLRVETTPPDGIVKFDCENPQRFSSRFINKVANTNDIVHFYARKKGATQRSAAANDGAAIAHREIEASVLKGHKDNSFAVEVEELVKKYLQKQSLNILPANYFGDAVTQFVTKDDKHAMEIFVNESLANQIKHLVALHNPRSSSGSYTGEEGVEEEDLGEKIKEYRTQLESLFAKGQLKTTAAAARKRKFKPKPDDWDSDFEGQSWVDTPGALMRPDETDRNGVDDEDDAFDDGTPLSSRRGSNSTTTTTTTHGRGGRGGRAARGGRASANKPSSTRGRGAAAKKSAASTRSRKKAETFSSDSDEEEELASDKDLMMIDSDEEEDDDDNSQAVFFPEPKSKSKPKTTTSKASSTRSTRITAAAAAATKPPPAAHTSAPPRKSISTAAAADTKPKQSTLHAFTHSQRSVMNGSANRSGGAVGGRSHSAAVSDDIEDDDDDDDSDAFEPVSAGGAAAVAGRKKR